MTRSPYARRRTAPGAPTTVRTSGNSPAAKAAERTMMIIPIIHTGADMGSLAGSIKRVTQEKLGRQAWQRQVQVIERMWNEIRRTVEGLPLLWERVRLYQDGLPRCGREHEIVNDLAQAGSPNHRLLLDLMDRGATLVGTESPDLLVHEYQLIRKVLDAKDSQQASTLQARDVAESDALLERRDRYIAKRINDSLRRGETGILFIGMLHRVAPHLAEDIRVTYPIYRLPRIRTRTA